MQRRELILLAVVGGLLLVLGAAFGAGRIRQALTARRAELARLQANDAGKITLQVQLSELKARKERLLDRSLPADVSVASNAYQKWLEELFDKQMGKAEITRDAASGRSTRDAESQRLSFTARCNGSYEQLVSFLAKFYAADHLHKITSLQFPSGQNPNPNSRVHPISIQIEALSLRQSTNTKSLSERPSVENTPEELQASVNALLRRDLFRENLPPTLDVASTVRVTAGRTINIGLRGSDPDGDKCEYKLISGPDWLQLKGDVLSAKAGSSPAQQDYAVKVSVTDNGLPRRTTEKSLTISVQPPPAVVVAKPPPKSRFDHSRFTKAEAFVERGGVAEVWINVQTLGEQHKVREGEEFEVDGQKYKVLDIDLDNKTLEVELPGNRRRTVGLNQGLGAN